MSSTGGNKAQKPKKVTQGKWTRAENDRFMKALEMYGRNWPLVQKKVKTRNVIQVRSHAQKIFQNMKKEDIDALIGGSDDATEESDEEFIRVGYLRKENFAQKLKLPSRKKQNKRSLLQVLKEETGKDSEQPSQTVEEVINFKVPEILSWSETQMERQKNSSMFMRIWCQNMDYFQNGGDFLFLTPSFNTQSCNSFEEGKKIQLSQIPITLQ